MSVLTEAKIRKLFREASIVEYGYFELMPDEKLTPAARSFLNDHHVKVITQSSNYSPASENSQHIKPKLVTTLEDSSVYPQLFKLTRLYPCLLQSQRDLHMAFQSDKIEQVGKVLLVLEKMVNGHILDDISDYQDTLSTGSDLQLVRVGQELDQMGLMMTYQAPSWSLTCYNSYIETVLVRKEFELLLADEFSIKVCQLLKSIEVLLWLVASD